MRLFVALMGCLTVMGCSADVDKEPADAGVEMCEYACLPPVSVMQGPSFSTWSSPTCSGTFARGPTSGPSHRPCALFPDGKVFCANYQAPVPKIYFVDPNDGVCKEWTITVEDWYEWPEVYPVPDQCVECTCDCPGGPPPPPQIDAYCAYPEHEGMACCRGSEPPGVCHEHECWPTL